MTVFSSNSQNIKLRHFKNFPHFLFCIYQHSSTLDNVQNITKNLTNEKQKIFLTISLNA